MKTLLSSAALALLLTLTACGDDKTGKTESEPTTKNNPEESAKIDSEAALAKAVVADFRKGSMKVFAAHLSETEGMGKRMAEEFERIKGDYEKADEAKKAEMRKELEKDGVEGIIDGTWRDGVSLRMFGSDGAKAEEMATFFKGLGEVKESGTDAGGTLFRAKSNAGGMLNLVVKKNADGNFIVLGFDQEEEGEEGPAPEGSPKEDGAKPVKKSAMPESEADAVAAMHKALLAFDAAGIAALLHPNEGMGKKASESITQFRGPAGAAAREGFAQMFGMEADSLKTITFPKMMEAILSKEILGKHKGIKEAIGQLGAFEKGEDQEMYGAWYTAKHPNGAKVEIGVKEITSGGYGITMLEVDQWPEE